MVRNLAPAGQGSLGAGAKKEPAEDCRLMRPRRHAGGANGSYTCTYMSLDAGAAVGQVTIYLDDETENKARAAAQASGLSLSRWVAERVRLGALSEWPAEVRELAGAWSDIPPAQQLRRSRTRDAKRTRL